MGGRVGWQPIGQKRRRAGRRRPAVAVVVSSYDNVKPLKTSATAIRRWGCGVVGREGVEGRGVEGRLYNIHNKIYT